MKSLTRAFGFILVACLMTLCARASELRVAILPVATELQPAADLLTAEFSKPNLGITLVERTELDRVRREQALTARSSADFARLGQTLGAHGVLVLDLFGGTNLTAKIIAVGPGVVLDFQAYPYPMTNTSGWPAIVANRFAPLLPKLTVLGRDALPISVLNLRASIKTPETLRLENDATTLLIHRLSARREVFVLERQRMAMLGAEKELKDIQESPFWNGSYLLEGVIEKGGATRDAISITARLVSPERRSETVAAKSETGDLNGLVEQLTQEILSRLNKSTSTPAWDAAAEAKRYLEEARWAMRSSAFKMAQAASDAAWTLGEHGIETALLRVRSYASTAPALVSSSGSLNGEYVGPTAAPSTDGIGSLTTALDNFAALTPQIGTNANLREWIETGTSALFDASSRLHQYWFYPQQISGAAEDLARLRASGREVERILLKENPAPDARTFDTSTGTNLWNMRVVNGWVFAGKPEDMVSEVRRLFGSSLTREQRLKLLEARCPWPMPWSTADRARASQVWQLFLDEMAGGTNALDAMTARLLATRDRLPTQRDQAEIELARRQLAAAKTFVLHRDELLCPEPELTRLTFKFLERTVVQRFKRLPGAEMFRSNVIDGIICKAACLDMELLPKCFQMIAFDTNHLAFLFDKIAQGVGTNSSAASKKIFLRAFLDNPHMFRQSVFDKLFDPQNCTPAEAATLLTRLDEWRKFDAANRPENVPLIDKQIAIVKPLAATGGVTAVAMTNVAPKFSPAVPVPAATAPSANPHVASIRLHWWQPPLTQSKTQVLERVSLRSAMTHDDELWVHVDFAERLLTPAGAGYDPDWYFISNRHAERFYRIDLSTKRAITSPDLVRGDDLPLNPFEDSPPADVIGNTLYKAEGNTLLSWSKGDAQWRKLDVTLPAAQITAIGQRLYFGSADTIVELNPANSAVRVMASRRRNPPVVEQDRFPNFGKPLFFPMGANQLWVLMNQSINVWDVSEGKWLSSRASRAGGTLSAGTILYWRGNLNAYEISGKRQLHRIHSDGSEEVLLEQGEERRTMMPQPRRSTTPQRTTKWLSPAGGVYASAIGEANLWAWDWRGRKLAFYDDRWDEPTTISINADMPTNAFPYKAATQLPNVKLLPMRSGLVFFEKQAPGFWFAPQAEVDAALAANTNVVHTPRKIVANSVAALPSSTPTTNTWNDEALPDAARILRKYDTSGDGVLDMREMARAIQSEAALKIYLPVIAKGQSTALLIKPYDTNHNGGIDVPELDAMLKATKPRVTR